AGPHEQARRQGDKHKSGGSAAVILLCVGLRAGSPGRRLGLLLLWLRRSTRREAVCDTPLVVEAVLVEDVRRLKGVVDRVAAFDLVEEIGEFFRAVRIVDVLDTASSHVCTGITFYL